VADQPEHRSGLVETGVRDGERHDIPGGHQVEGHDAVPAVVVGGHEAQFPLCFDGQHGAR
jgi:hypothetical protein